MKIIMVNFGGCPNIKFIYETRTQHSLYIYSSHYHMLWKYEKSIWKYIRLHTAIPYIHLPSMQFLTYTKIYVEHKLKLLHYGKFWFFLLALHAYTLHSRARLSKHTLVWARPAHMMHRARMRSSNIFYITYSFKNIANRSSFEYYEHFNMINIPAPSRRVASSVQAKK